MIMKTVLILLTFFTFTYAAHIDEFASEVGYLRDYKTAVKTAKEQNKMVMLVVVGDYCPWCKKFERKTLKASQVREVVDKEFVPVIIDKYKEKDKYPKDFYAPFIPTVYFIDPSTERSLLETVAYMKKAEYMENMDDALSLFEQEKDK